MNKETQAQLWKKINEPKITEIIRFPDKTYMVILDRIPKITRQRKKN
jgi:hypothetical protein